MAAASHPTPTRTGKGPGTGLPLSMTSDELAMAVDFIVAIWWPQLCHSSRTRSMKDTGLFQDGWYDDAGLLDIHNPAFWKILNALGNLYGKIHMRYPGEAIHTFRVRWQAARNEDMVFLRAEGRKNGTPHGPAKGFRIKSPRSGWLDFQMEMDVLKARRDAADETMHAKDAAIAPKMVIAGDGSFVHSATFRPTAGPAFSPAQRKNIAENIAVALTDESVHKLSRSNALSEDEQVSAKVSKWIASFEDQDPFLDHPDVRKIDTSTVDGPSTEEELVEKKMGVTREEWDPAVDDPAIVPDMEDYSDVEDIDLYGWVKVGEGDDADDFMVPLASTFKYKKADAHSARRGWFKGWLY